VLRYLDEHAPDVLALQETKVPDERFPHADIEAAGYQVVFCCQKTYNGVAILSKNTASDVLANNPDFDDAQPRMLAATVDGVRIIDVYIPNGQEVGSEKYQYKLRWLDAFSVFLQQQMQAYEKLIVLGDFNIAPADIDIHDPLRWQGKIMCSDIERAHFSAMLDFGLSDCVRLIHPEEGMHSWWDYRLNAFPRNWGIRIDHVLATTALQANTAGVHRSERGLERPSDHAPVWVELVTET